LQGGGLDWVADLVAEDLNHVDGIAVFGDPNAHRAVMRVEDVVPMGE
jgi:hypothetical protein